MSAVLDIAAVLPWAVILPVAGVLFLLWLVLRPRPRRAALSDTRSWVLVDGSNVMHWDNQTPRIDTVRAVVRLLEARGLNPAVIFDANAGWKLKGRYQSDQDLALALDLPRDQVLVVPKGEQADPWLLQTARNRKARVVSNDRFRDWADQAPEVATKGFLIRGGVRDGKVWVEGPEGEGAPTARG